MPRMYRLLEVRMAPSLPDAIRSSFSLSLSHLASTLSRCGCEKSTSACWSSRLPHSGSQVS